MIRSVIGFTFAAMLTLGTSAIAQTETKYGKEFKEDNAIDVATFMQAIDKKNEIKDVTVKGTITQVCQAAGCWVKLKNNNGPDLFVKFKGDKFLVPADVAGQEITVHGKGVKKTISVEERKHLAEDAGATTDEIAEITEPKQELRIEATGAVLR